MTRDDFDNMTKDEFDEYILQKAEELDKQTNGFALRYYSGPGNFLQSVYKHKINGLFELHEDALDDLIEKILEDFKNKDLVKRVMKS